MSVLLANATIASLDPPEILPAHISVRGDRIASVDKELPTTEHEEIISCAGRLVIPGNVCAHTHLYSALARGMPGPKVQPTDFREILQHIWWRLDRALDHDAIRYSALVGGMDAVRAGTSTLVDHHASPNAIDGSLDVLAGALQEVGARAVLCYEVTDRDGMERRDAGLRENERFLRSNRSATMRGMVGAHASFTLGDDSLQLLSELGSALGTGVHIHVAEDAWDEEDSLQRSGLRTAERLKQAGVIRQGSIAAHGVHLDNEEIGAIDRAGGWLVHNCRSNMNNGVGRAPIGAFPERAALGTDGIDGDMFAESRTAFFRAREVSIATGAERIAGLVGGGARLASDQFGAPMGTIRPGALADLVILRYDPPTPLTAGNFAWHWMFALSSENVESVMVGGRWVLRDGALCAVDEEKIRREARVQAERLWKRMEAL